jgi:hypothetical protein
MTKNFSKEEFCGVSHQYPRVFGAEEPGAGKKDQMGKAVSDRSANENNQGFLEINRQKAQGSHGRPSDDVTESDNE